MSFLKNILSTTVIIGIFVLHPSLNKGDNIVTVIQHYVYGNSLKISTNDTIDKNLLEIKWACKTNKETKTLVIFKNDKQINQIPSEKGNQILLVYYNNKIIGELPHKKYFKNQANHYQIELLSKGSLLFFKGDIIGPSPYKGKPITIASL